MGDRRLVSPLAGGRVQPQTPEPERDFFIDNLLVRIHFIIEIIWWTGLAPWKFGFLFSGVLTSTFPVQVGSRSAEGSGVRKPRPGSALVEAAQANPLYHRDDLVDRPCAMEV